MRSASFLRPSNSHGAPWRDRVAPFLLVLCIHVLLPIMMLRLAPAPDQPAAKPEPILVSLLPGKRIEPTRARAARAIRAKGGASRSKPAAKAPATSLAAAIWSKVIPISRQDLLAADLARPSRPAEHMTEEARADRSAADGKGASADLAGGAAGQQLYDADWYRKPTDAELAPYLPPGAPRRGWGEVACHMVADYRVEDCREIAQYPAGSGLARAVREASWQFRVLPPRINGRPLIGAWVRIRIDYSEKDVSSG